MRVEADRHTLSPLCIASVLLEGAFVRDKGFRNPGVAGPGEVGKNLRPVFVQGLRQFVQADKTNDLILRLGLGHQLLALLTGRFVGQLFGLYEIGEGLAGFVFRQDCRFPLGNR